jgi:hypothetical protein
MSDPTFVGQPCVISDMSKHAVTTIADAIVHYCYLCHAVTCSDCMA